MKNKGFAVLISCMMMLTAVPLQSVFELQCVSAETTSEINESVHHLDMAGYGGFDYINHGDFIEITSCQGEIAIPNEIDGLPVTSFAASACENKNIASLILPDSITTIPKNCFRNCKRLRKVVLPKGITSIETGAFDGCPNLRDVFYKGTDEQWDEVVVGTSNAPLQNAYIHTNYNRTIKNKSQFVDGEDNWCFSNGQLTEYLLTDEMLCKYLANCHPDTIDWYLSCRDACFDMDYQGACAGFALTSYLVSVGILKPSDIYEGAETLYEIPLCDQAVEAVSFYFLQTIKEWMFQVQLGSDEDDVYIKSGQFRFDMEQGIPVCLTYMVDLGMHSVVAYGIEQGEWQYGDNLYTGRILISDNNYTSFEDEACIYFNDNFDEMYIPYWNSTAVFSDFFYETDRLSYGIGNRTSYQSTYKAGDLDKDESVNAVDAAEILTAAASEGSGSDSGLNNGQRFASDVNADGELNALDAALVLQYAAYAGAGGELSFEEYLLQME